MSLIFFMKLCEAYSSGAVIDDVAFVLLGLLYLGDCILIRGR